MAKAKLFGIPNCDTVKKVRSHLEKCAMDYEFIDFKKHPPIASDIERWRTYLKSWPVNSKGPTFRKIREKFEAGSDREKYELLIQNSSAIKRPILEREGKVLGVGLDLIQTKF